MFQSEPTEELVRLCAVSEDLEAWEEFVRRFHRVIASVVLRTASRLGDSSSALVDDLIQETYLKLCANNFRLLRDFTGPHPDSFFGFVKVVAANLVRDHFRSLQREKHGQHYPIDPDVVMTATAEPVQGGIPISIGRQLLMSEVDNHLKACTPGADQARNCRIFWLYYQIGFSASEIAALPGTGLTTKGVESLLFRITQDLRRRMTSPPTTANVLERKSTRGIYPA